MPRVIQRLAARWRGEHAPLEIPQLAAAGATDRELARLGPDPTRRLADVMQHSRLRLDLTIARYL